MRNHVAIAVQECTLHQIIVEIAEDRLNVIVLTSLFIRIPEFIIAPSQGGGGIVFRHTKLHMVTCIMESAGNIYIAVAVRIKHIFILREKICAQIGSCTVHCNLCIICMTVSTPTVPVVFLHLCTAHISIIKVNGILQRPCKVRFLLLCRTSRN